jgi:hypothetical protein
VITLIHSIIRGRQAGSPGPETRARTGPGPSQSRAHIIRGRQVGQDTPGHSRASEPAWPSTVQSSTHSCTLRDGGPGRSTRALTLPRHRPDHSQSLHTTRRTLGGGPAGYSRAFKLPRIRPSHARPIHIAHGTAGRRERPSGDTGPATAHPSGTRTLTRGGQAGTNRQRRPAGPVAREAQHATPVLTLEWQVQSNWARHAREPAVTARARDVRNAKAKAQSSGNMGHGYLQRER